jgi:hypothetical protein
VATKDKAKRTEQKRAQRARRTAEKVAAERAANAAQMALTRAVNGHETDTRPAIWGRGSYDSEREWQGLIGNGGTNRYDEGYDRDPWHGMDSAALTAGFPDYWNRVCPYSGDERLWVFYCLRQKWPMREAARLRRSDAAEPDPDELASVASERRQRKAEARGTEIWSRILIGCGKAVDVNLTLTP